VLGRIGDIQRSEPTLNSFTDPVHYKRMAVVQSLMQMATDWDDDVRLAAVEALGRLADERARGILTESLRDRTIWVQEAAEFSLTQLRAPEVGPVEAGMGLERQN